jgi:hypothetical protein
MIGDNSKYKNSKPTFTTIGSTSSPFAAKFEATTTTDVEGARVTLNGATTTSDNCVTIQEAVRRLSPCHNNGTLPTQSFGQSGF